MEQIIAIVGPTAVGKTALSFHLADHYGTELISGDAYQIYRHMDIGTAKPTAAELLRFRHHLIDIAEPGEAYSAARFCAMAGDVAHALQRQGKVPVLVGGTGLYVQSFLEGFTFDGSAVDEAARTAARERIAAMGEAELIAYIRQQTEWEVPDWHELVSNEHRLVRLMVAIEKGEGRTFVRSGKDRTLAWPAYVIGLSLPRPVLYERIETRIDVMLEEGWVEEVERLLAAGVDPACQAMKAIGYAELTAYVHGELTLDEAAATIKTRTRHFAKRQLTWFKRMPYIHWFAKEEYDSEDALARAVLTETDAWLARTERP